MNLYVHIPFCPKICPYCSFYKEASDRNKTQAFLDAVLKEAALIPFQPQTVFFGGGTPTALSSKQLEYLICGLQARLDFSQVREWTVEMNPATVSLEKARLLLGLGVTRISMGIQSWDVELLQTLGRVHTAVQAEHSYDILREAGFSNINLDLMFGIPGQTIRQWEDSLRKTIALHPEHVSAYCLTYEEDTEYFLRLGKGIYRQDPENEIALFEITMTLLEKGGYQQYEISNYARPGKECRHNLAYWNGADYIGLGPSAFSTMGPSRWSNFASTSQYIQQISEGKDAASFREILSPEIRQSERIAFGLRTHRGVPSAWISRHQKKVDEFLKLGLLEMEEQTVRLSRPGRLLADSVAAELL
ncbi:MAG: coproporphyrinogen III oxidase [Verrucomicrobia bacterium]|nr:MAG: coproporphyrinogen III oxidase [Verrucomicrobiota bacterium]